MAAKKPGERRSEYYARIGRIGGMKTKSKHGGRIGRAPAKKKK